MKTRNNDGVKCSPFVPKCNGENQATCGKDQSQTGNNVEHYGNPWVIALDIHNGCSVIRDSIYKHQQQIRELVHSNNSIAHMYM